MEAELKALSLDIQEIKKTLKSLVEREVKKDFYSTEEFAALVGRSEFTVREWCRLDRIYGEKKKSGRGKHEGWRIAHEEYLRYQKDGLLPGR